MNQDARCICCGSISIKTISPLEKCPKTSPPTKYSEMFSIFADKLHAILIRQTLGPCAICGVCASKLTRAFEFYQRCLQQLDDAPKLMEWSTVSHKYRPIQSKPFTALLDDSPTSNVANRALSRHYRCKSCRQTFATKHDLAIHRRQRHLTPKPDLLCPRCSTQFHTKHTFALHTKLHDDNICVYCNTGFGAEPQLTEHVNQTHGGEPLGRRRFVCFKCQRCYWTRRMLLRHSRLVHCKADDAHHGVWLRCGLCRQQDFRSRQELRAHVLACRVDSATTKLDLFDAHCGAGDDGMPVEFLNYNLLTEDDYYFDANHLLLGNDDHQQPHPIGMVEEFLDEAFQISSYDPSMLNLLMDGIGVDKAVQNTEHPLQHCYSCPRCEDGAPLMHSQLELNQHLAHVHHEPVLVCNECGAKFSKTNDLTAHRSQHKYENRVANESLSTFFGSATLPSLDHDRFARSTDSAGTTIFACKHCPRTYKTTPNMLKHQCTAIRHTVAPNAHCPECSTTFTNQQELALHRKTTHVPDDTLCCSLCDKRFTTIAGLKYHLKTHTGIRSIGCPFCARKFMANGNLHAHIRTVHSAVRPHACPTCDQRFASAYHLRRHVASAHRQERAFACAVCGKRFGQQSHLTQHGWRHTGVKPFPCERCTAAYTSRTALKKHLRMVHREAVADEEADGEVQEQ